MNIEDIHCENCDSNIEASEYVGNHYGSTWCERCTNRAIQSIMVIILHAELDVLDGIDKAQNGYTIELHKKLLNSYIKQVDSMNETSRNKRKPVELPITIKEAHYG